MSVTFQPPPVRTPFPDVKQWQATGTPAWPWMQFFLAIAARFNALFADPPAVTGSRGGNAALASLLTELAKQGYIVDKTTP